MTTTRLPGNGGWQITQAFDGPDLTTDVALGGGRLALTRNTTTELYERGATGPFDLVRRFHGLERVFHLDDTRIAGLTSTGAAVRIVPLDPNGTGDVSVCQERGAVVCDSSHSSAPRLRVFFQSTPWPAFTPRLVAAIEDAQPGALALAYRAHDLAWNPFAGAALCLDGSTAIRAAPALVDANGRASVDFDVSNQSLHSLLPTSLFVQAAVVGGRVVATEAVRMTL
jgi:hypothetical protein